MAADAVVVVEATPMAMSTPSCARPITEVHAYHMMNPTHHAITRRADGEWSDDSHTIAITSMRASGADLHVGRP